MNLDRESCRQAWARRQEARQAAAVLGLFIMLFGTMPGVVRAVPIDGLKPDGNTASVPITQDKLFMVDARISSSPVSSTMTVSQVAVSSTVPTLVVSASTRTLESLLRNCSDQGGAAGVEMYWGGVAVSTSSGFLLKPSEVLSPDNPPAYRGGVYFISAGPGGVICKAIFQ